MPSSKNELLQPFRFRINRSALQNQAVEVIDFPWSEKIETFYSRIQVELQRELRPNELAPWRTLNDALNLSAYLIQPFESNYRKRQAIAPEGVQLPQANQIAAISQNWLNYYTMSVFPELRERRPRPFTELLSGLTFNELWHDREALSLIAPGNIDGIAFNAIPSIVASSIIERPIIYKGERITWRAAQQSRKLCLVSKPIHSHLDIDGDDITGYFVIRAEFSLRTMPGEADPFIDMSLHCRRYIESTGSWTRRKSGTALIEVVNPLIQGWPQKSLVQVPLHFSKISKENPESVYYKNGIDSFLAELRAAPLVPLANILSEPTKYWNIEMGPRDAYYLVYHEGMYPNHPVETGWPVADQNEIYHSLCSNLDGILQPVEPVQRSLRMFRKTKPTAGLHIGELQERDRMDEIDAEGQTETIPVENLGIPIAQAVKQIWLMKQSKPLVLLLWHTPVTREAVMKQFDELMCGEMEIKERKVDATLIGELVSDAEFDTSQISVVRPDGSRDNKYYGTKMGEYKDVIVERRKARISQWIPFLRSVRQEFAMTGNPVNPPEILVIIEQLKTSEHKIDEMRSPKSAIREACIQSRFLSQFIRTVEYPEKESTKENGQPRGKSDYYRVQGAVHDLMLRQTGITLGAWEAFFERLSLPAVAQNMEIIGLYRAKSQMLNFDIPIAIRFTPISRHAEMTYPGLRSSALLSRMGSPLEWLPYTQACIELGQLVIKNKGKILTRKKDSKVFSDVCLNNGQMLDFIDKIIRGPGKEKIVLIDAMQFRNTLWKELKNGDMVMNQYKSPGYGMLTPVELPGVRLIRVLAGESPQYTSVGNLKEPDNALYIAGDSSGFPVFYSVGALSTVRRQVFKESKKEAEFRHPESEARNYISKADYADTAFKHSQMVEMIPFFLQPGDDPELFTWIAHRLRTTLNWAAGNIIYPRPIHLADAFVEDVRILFDSDNEQEASE